MPKERPRLIPSHGMKVPSSTHTAGRLPAYSSGYQGENFPQTGPYGSRTVQSKPRPMPNDLSQSVEERINPEMYEQNRRLPGSNHPPPSTHLLDLHQQRERPHMNIGMDKGNSSLRPPHMEPTPLPSRPKKARYHEAVRMTTGVPPWSQPLHINTNMDTNKMKQQQDPLGGYHPETEAISPTLPTESHDSKSDIVHSINEVDRELNLIENQIQQLQKKQLELEAEAAKPAQRLPEEDPTESKPLSIAQIVYKENRRYAHKSHDLLSKLKYTDPTTPADLPLFHQPSDTAVYHENVKKFSTFKSVLQTYFKRKAEERARTEAYWADNYERLVMSWLKKVDAKTLKKNIKDHKTREYYEKVFPEIKKQREDKERITSRVGARGVSSGYARTEAEFEQIVDGITEQEEEEKKMRAYAIIPPMLSQTQRKFQFINRNGLIEEPMSEYKQRKQLTNWSAEEKEIFKEKYLERPKQFGQIAEILEKKTLNDCVLYYYMSKKSENYKQLLKKQVKRPPRRVQMKPSMRTSNEGQNVSLPEGTSCGTTNCDTNDQDVISVTRPASEDSKQNSCVACGKKLESYSLSQALTRNTCTQFGLNVNDFQTTWRVCSECSKLRRRKTKICPIPSCSSPHRRIRHLPVHWQQIPPPIKAKIMSELQMDEEVKRCCSACYDKVADLLLDGDNDTDDSSSRGRYAAKWTTEDISSYKNGIRQHGKEWQAVASLVQSKSQNQCRMYFYRNKKRLGLDIIYNEFRKQKASEGLDIEPSDDSADEDDDNVEDNDLSSENENTSPTDSPLNPVIGKVEVQPSTIKKEELFESKPEKIALGSPAVPMVNGDMVPGDGLGPVKSETVDVTKASVKQEKMDYDSSATASADEEHPVDNHFLEDRLSTNPLSKAMSFVKQEPGLMSNPDGMFPPTNSVFPGAMGMPHSLSMKSKNQSTSVADLINLAIEDALSGGDPANDVASSGNSRQSVINNKNSLGSASLIKSNQPQDMTTGGHAQSKSSSMSVSHPTQHVSIVDDPMVQARRATPAPYEGDPRAFVQASKEKQHLGSQRFQMSGTMDGNPVRAPPPAHSHHLTPVLDKRNNDRKSPATQFPVYDKTGNSDNGMSLHGRQTIGQPPPLISSGQQHMLSHVQQHIKKESSHAGGSILKGTSATHSQQPSRFEGGSISHGTPRNQSEPKPLPQTSRGDEKSCRSPRSQPGMHSPAVPSTVPVAIPGTASHMLEQQRQLMYLQQLQGAIRPSLSHNFSQLAAGSFPPAAAAIAAFESYQTKSVLQNDFKTAQQMTNNSVNVPVNASAYSSALDKEKTSQMSPHPRDASLLAAKGTGVQPSLFDQQQMMMLMNNPRLMAPRISDRSRLPIMPMSSPAATKEEARSWTLVNKNSQPNRPVSEPPRGQKPVIIPKTVEMLQRPQENSRRSASPHAKREGKTRYEKDIEEMKYKADRSQQEKSGYHHKPQLAPNYSKSMMASMKQDELLREKSAESRERHALDYREKLSSQYPRSPYGAHEDSHHTGQSGGDKRPDSADHCSSYGDALHCKKLHQVSQVIRKEQLPKDASALFSSSFEKDSHTQRSMFSGGTTANIINEIITKQINNESSNEQNRQLAAAASHQHTSVIVPPKKQRTLPQSRSETDISSYGAAERLSGSAVETPGTASMPLPSSGSSTPRNSGHITLADKINEIITNDYNGVRASENSDGYPSYPKSERPASNSSTLQPYKVEDVEPISPPNASGSQSKNSKFGDNQNNAGKLGVPGSKKHAGIRSLLVADNSSSGDTNKPVEGFSAPAGGMSLMDVLKNNIDEAIRHDVDLSTANGQAKPRLCGTGQHPYGSKAERLGDANMQRDNGSKKRNLEAMLAPTGKRAAVSPRRDKSPEEVEMYPSSTSSSSALLPSSGPSYRPPVSNPYSNASLYNRSLPPSHYHQQMSSGGPFNTPNSPSKASPHNPNVATSKPPPTHLNTDHILPGYSNIPVSSHPYYQQRNSIPSSRYPANVPTSRATSTDELVIDESSNSGTESKHGGMSHSPAGGAMRSPGIASSNRMSPISGYHNNNTAHSNNRASPIAAAPAVSRTSPLTNMPTCIRKSPISVPASNNRMSPGVYGGAQASSSRPSSRQSPALSNRQSPIASGHSPLDGMVKSPLTSVESSTSRGNHLNTDACKFSSINENSITHGLVPKPLDATRSLNSLGKSQSRPLLSEHYETLSDDDR